MSEFFKGRAHAERISRTEDGRKVARHDDYKRRSQLFKRKRALIRAGRKAAASKNPDEFHFAMEHARTGQDGQLQFASKSLSPEAARKSIDRARRAIRYESSIEASKLQRATASSALSVTLPPGGVRTFEDSSDDEREASKLSSPFSALTSAESLRKDRTVVVSDAVPLARPTTASAIRNEVLARKQKSSRLRLHAASLEEDRRRTSLKRTRSVTVGEGGPPSKRRRLVLNRQLRAK